MENHETNRFNAWRMQRLRDYIQEYEAEAEIYISELKMKIDLLKALPFEEDKEEEIAVFEEEIRWAEKDLEKEKKATDEKIKQIENKEV